MSTSLTVLHRPTHPETRATSASTLDTAALDSGLVLTALNDAVCRRLLAACDEEPRTAQECATTCEVPLSTVYRKLGALTDAGLLTERVRVDADRTFPNEFAARFETFSVSLAGNDGVVIEATPIVDENEVDEVSQ